MEQRELKKSSRFKKDLNFLSNSDRQDYEFLLRIRGLLWKGTKYESYLENYKIVFGMIKKMFTRIACQTLEIKCNKNQHIVHELRLIKILLPKYLENMVRYINIFGREFSIDDDKRVKGFKKGIKNFKMDDEGPKDGFKNFMENFANIVLDTAGFAYSDESKKMLLNIFNLNKEYLQVFLKNNLLTFLTIQIIAEYKPDERSELFIKILTLIKEDIKEKESVLSEMDEQKLSLLIDISDNLRDISLKEQKIILEQILEIMGKIKEQTELAGENKGLEKLKNRIENKLKIVELKQSYVDKDTGCAQQPEKITTITFFDEDTTRDRPEYTNPRIQFPLLKLELESFGEEFDDEETSEDFNTRDERDEDKPKITILETLQSTNNKASGRISLER